MTVKDFLYEEWLKTCVMRGEAEAKFYDKYIPPCAPSEIEDLFIAAVTEEGQRGFYAGMEAFRRISLEFGLYGAMDISKES